MADAVQYQISPKRNALTQKRLHELLDYDPETGIFKWRVQVRSDIPPGTVAGGVQKRGYLTIWIDKVGHFAHRLAWMYVNGSFPNGLIDHINGIVDDNRIANLRVASQHGNAQNRCGLKRENGLPKGVYRKKNYKKFFSTIICNGKNYYLGTFPTIEAAQEAYSKKASELFGEFARDLSS